MTEDVWPDWTTNKTDLETKVAGAVAENVLKLGPEDPLDWWVAAMDN